MTQIMNRIFILFCGFFLGMIIGSCRDDYSICNENREVKFAATFYQKMAGVDIIATAPSLSIKNIAANTSAYTNQSNQTNFYLTLDAQKDSLQYLVMLANNLPPDTLTIVYTSQSRNISADCGNVFMYNITKIYSTIHSIDSIKLLNPAVTNSLTQNAKIYF